MASQRKNMKKFNKKIIITLASLALVIFAGASYVFAFGSPATVNLGKAGNFTILAKTGVSTTGATTVTGDIGVSPNSATSLTGFSQTMDSSNRFSTSTYVVGKLYAADYAVPTPSYTGTSVSAMEAAYTDAMGRPADETGRGAGTLTTGEIFTTGVYKWNSDVNITDDITINGSATDIFIFQITGKLNIDSGKKVLLSGGVIPANIFWAVAGTTTLQTTSIFEGNILGGSGASTIAMLNGATLHGKALGQTDVTLIASIVTSPTTGVYDDIPVVVSHSSGGSMPVYGCNDPTATNYNYFSASDPSLCQYENVVVLTPTTIATTGAPLVIVPKLPKTGFPPQEVNGSWYSVLFSSILNLFR